MVMIGLLSAAAGIIYYKVTGLNDDRFVIGISLGVIFCFISILLLVAGCTNIVDSNTEYGKIRSYLSGIAVPIGYDQRLLVTEEWCVDRINYHRSRRAWWATRVFTPPIPEDLASYGLLNTGGK
jgi:hypothetical protein